MLSRRVDHHPFDHRIGWRVAQSVQLVPAGKGKSGDKFEAVMRGGIDDIAEQRAPLIVVQAAHIALAVNRMS